MISKVCIVHNAVFYIRQAKSTDTCAAFPLVLYSFYVFYFTGLDSGASRW